MIKLTLERKEELRKNFSGKRIAVVGDMMLDCYITGDVKRISPEAPVPVIEVENEFYRFGGAANVAYNIVSLGGVPIPVGVIGDDQYGNIFKKLLSDVGIDSSGLLITQTRPTTAKTRVIAQGQHIVRIDKEVKEDINKDEENALFNSLISLADTLDGIILEDYNKGVLTASLIEKIIAYFKEKNVLITVDPKFNNLMSYQGVTVFKPNRKEAEAILGMRIKTSEDVSSAGKKLLELLDAQYVLLTLSEEGIAVFQKDGPEKRMPTKAQKVADVSGAGDTVISTLTMALAAGANILESSYLANYAGGIVCGEVGVVPIQLAQLFEVI